MIFHTPYRKVLFSILFIIFHFQYLLAQHYDIRQYGVSDGLPSASVYSVFQDSRDFLWISGQDGLSKFDGKKFQNISSDETDSISNIDVAFEDSLGNLWGNTIYGPYKFDGRRFINYPFQNKPRNLWVTQQFITKNKKIWVTVGSGIYELQNNVWVKIPFIKNDDLVFYNQVVELDDNRLLFNFRDSLCVYDKYQNLNRIICNEELFPVFKSVRTFNSEIFVFTNKRVYKFKNDSLIVIYPDEINGFVSDVYLDRSGKLWVAIGSQGVKIFDYYSSNQKSIDKIIILGEVYDIMQDRYGNMWLSGNSGLYRLTPRYIHFIAKPKGLICKVFNAGDGKIIIGRIEGEPFVFRDDSLIPVSENYNYRGKFKYSGAWMYSITIDKEQRIWMGNNHGNIYRINSNQIEDLSGRFQSFKRVMGALTYNRSKDAIYLSGDTGIVKVRNDSIVKNFSVFQNQGEYVNAMNTDYSGRTWFCIESKTAIVGYIKNDSVFTVKNFSIKLFSDSHFYFDSSGYTYITTKTQGVFKIHLITSDSIKIDYHFSTKNGFISNLINAIDFDKSGRMWVASTSGIFSIRIIDSLHYNVSKYNLDALTGVTDWSLCYLVFDGSNRIYFTNRYGAGYIECDKVVENVIPPKIYISDISIADNKVNWMEYCRLLTPFFFTPVKPVLPFSLNQFIISYTSACYSDADEIYYSYNMNDNDSSWIFNGTSNKVSLINLAPGNYVFKVHSRTANSPWSKAAIFEFKINPPWYRTGLFYGLSIVICGTGLIFYLKRRRDQFALKLKTQQHLHELEQRLLRVQMNPHFIFNSLRSINEYIQSHKTILASEYLIQFSKLMRAILENSRQKEIVLSKEIEVLELYMALESQRMEHPFSYSIEIDPEIDPENTLIPPMLLQPIVENSIWHGLAPRNKPGKIIIRVKKQNETIQCEVEDNGIGREVSSISNNGLKAESHGLKITAERLGIIEQIKKIETNLKFRDLNGDNNFTGLNVTFTLPFEEAV
ncbi:MAG: histidine kinase [Chitinophagales bacterium]|nr:histidine kinase [Chitinophagales bacterium]